MSISQTMLEHSTETETRRCEYHRPVFVTFSFALPYSTTDGPVPCPVVYRVRSAVCMLLA